MFLSVRQVGRGPSSSKISTAMSGLVRSPPWMSWLWSWGVWGCPPPSRSSSPTCVTRGARSALPTSWRSCMATARRRAFLGSYWRPSGGWTLKERVTFQQRWNNSHMCKRFVDQVIFTNIFLGFVAHFGQMGWKAEPSRRWHSTMKQFFSNFCTKFTNRRVSLWYSPVDQIFREANIHPSGQVMANTNDKYTVFWQQFQPKILQVKYEEFVKIVCAPVPDYYWGNREQIGETNNQG